ncbi:MAG: DUF1634 domain-containing protein [Acidimicrobiaceae bacterium]|nr:DUF1634 domain-containing protein [Acidimicrobiaceae bacterium]
MTESEEMPIAVGGHSGQVPTGRDRVHHRDVDEEKLRKVETAISYVLRIGVVASVITVLIGMVMVFRHHPGYASITGKVSYHTVADSTTSFPHTIGQLGTALSQGTGEGVIVLGLIILLATPVMRVAVGVLSFIYEKDPPMTIVTLFVLAVLIASFFLG